jgi:hypothetical protein
MNIQFAQPHIAEQAMIHLNMLFVFNELSVRAHMNPPNQIKLDGAIHDTENKHITDILTKYEGTII